MESQNFIVFFHKLGHVYEGFCKPLCKKLQINQTAFDILLFLANNPRYQTARDITYFRGIKANLVSFTVEKLVQEGYLTRFAVPDDRRKIGLACTKKAEPIIQEGRKIQKSFVDAAVKNLSKEELQHFLSCLGTMERNIDSLTEG